MIICPNIVSNVHFYIGFSFVCKTILVAQFGNTFQLSKSVFHGLNCIIKSVSRAPENFKKINKHINK